MTAWISKLKDRLMESDLVYDLYFKRHARKQLETFKAKVSQEVDLLVTLPQEQQQYWSERIQLVIDCPDNIYIDRVPNAGKMIGDYLVMHNGIKIDPLSYYSFPMLQMLIANRGVHEPQEEKIFDQVLSSLPTSTTPKTMLELGAYWSFYSMCFLQAFPTANCYMVEPQRRNLFYGKQNFKINQRKGTFIQAKIGSAPDKSIQLESVDHICEQHNIDFLDVLHADIQGFELEMLKGSKRMLSTDKVGYIFVSTHSNELHYACRKVLAGEYNLTEVAHTDLDNTYSWDGLLVFKSPNYSGINKVNIAQRQQV